MSGQAAAPAPQRGGAGSDRRAELVLGAVSVCLLAFIGLMTVTVFVEGWPSFAHNGYYKWFLPGGDVDTQLRKILDGPTSPAHYYYHLRAWPLLWGTLLTTFFAVVFALIFAIFASIFIAELAPRSVRRVLEPVVRLLASVPSVVYGLIGILALAPLIEKAFISQERKHSVQYVVQITGENLTLGIIILMVMILPIMVSLIMSALSTVPRSWIEGSEALGANRWRTIRRVSLHAVRPAIVAATVLATARALGEAIMLSLVAGSRAFPVNPLDGFTALFEPVQPLAATIVENVEGLSTVPFGHTLYAMAAVLLVSCALLSFAGWAVKQPLKRYGIGV
ncbi:MAG TPA: phosphate ABC transporter permease subunit PstC [Solirubrobacteraceae bacterium]|jgi:phosphate ABC transporter permease protein PstC